MVECERCELRSVIVVTGSRPEVVKLASVIYALKDFEMYFVFV